MAEVQQVQPQSGQPSASSQSQPQRGSRQRRGPRRGRGRGGQTAVIAGADAGQGNHQNPRNNAAVHVTPNSNNNNNNTASTTNNNRSTNNNNQQANSQDGNGRQNPTPSVSSRGSSRGGRGARGGRGGRGGQAQSQRGGGGRGGRGGSTIPSRRAFGGHLTEAQDGEAQGSAGLSGDAPEFVPGHAPPQGRSQPKQPPPPAVLPAKSSAPDLPTRIHEDINNRQYDCVICMNEILRSSREVPCLATLYEQQTREPLICDDECLRLKRNRRLADALNIDPDSHSDDHIPYSETTLKLFRENVGWAQTQEREFRVFASDAAEKRLRFKPMKPSQRAFLHALAEDYGFDSESQDPEPHRHVSIFKTPRFVSAPRKTLGQCVNMLKIAAEAEAVARSSAVQQQAKTTALQPFNAFVLSKLTFGLTIDEVDKALAADLLSSNAMSLTFSTTFLPATDEVLVVAKPPPATAANITRSGVATTPVAVENALTSLKPAVSKTMAKTGLAGNVSLCHVDPTGIVVRREGHSSGGPDAGGWSAVAGRAAARPRTVAPPAAKKTGSVFLALGRKKPAAPEAPKAKKPEPEPVEDDWEAAVDKMEEPTEEAEAS
ncbi:hypothetical protein PspLS_04208 [Pyricularia sp. CBS 133598]|nr:hypothetical protein PspLS_04208 [Pyricularia sp. CBS 133598]